MLKAWIRAGGVRAFSLAWLTKISRGDQMNTAATVAIDQFQTEASTAKRDELITEHLHLVTAIAAHVRRSISVHTELDDLVHAGTMGLFDAASKYQAEKE